MRFAYLASLIAAATFAIAACGGGDQGGEPTGATCPEGSALTYDNFAAGFFTTYCTTCHASDLTGLDRHGAPSDHNFDTLQGVIDELDHVDEAAAAGPDAVNTVMPPEDDAVNDVPSEEERFDLGEWLACGAPN